MIPKIIHYCWFGRKPFPKLGIRCIKSWKKYFPDYEIKEWNEDNFDVSMIPYIRESYKAGKYAFVSDFARFWILFHHGGIYFDTDVEVIKSFYEIIEHGPFMGIEKDGDIISIAPGLGMAAFPNMDFYRDMISVFENYNSHNGILPIMIRETTELFITKGFIPEDKKQTIDGIILYPNEFFNPKDDYTGKINITQNTLSIHHFAKSWVENYGPIRNRLTQIYHRFKL